MFCVNKRKLGLLKVEFYKLHIEIPMRREVSANSFLRVKKYTHILDNAKKNNYNNLKTQKSYEGVKKLWHTNTLNGLKN